MKVQSRLLFIGSKRVGLSVLGLLASQFPDHLVGAVTLDDSRDSRSVLDEFRKFSQDNSISLKIVANRESLSEVIAGFEPTRCIVVGWYWIFPKKVLGLARDGFTGLHFSKLPKDRGGAPLVWALLRGDREVWYSIFDIQEGMDDGPLWKQGQVPVSPGEPIGSVLPRLELAAIEGFKEVLPHMIHDSGVPIPQPSQGATYCRQRSEKDGQINWNTDALTIQNFICAQSRPYPGAFSFLGGIKLRIWSSKPNDVEGGHNQVPGTVLSRDGKRVLVACGLNTSIWLEEWEGVDSVSVWARLDS